MKIRIIIVEEEEERRKLTVSILQEYPDIACIGDFADAESFRARMSDLQPDVVLMDMDLPKQSGIECVRALASQENDTKFVMFTKHFDPKEVFDALKAGAIGFILKEEEPEQLAKAIREVQAGGSPMPIQVSRMLFESFNKTEEKLPELESLTDREWEVLQALKKGSTYKQIAAKLFVSLETIHALVRSIHGKL